MAKRVMTPELLAKMAAGRRAAAEARAAKAAAEPVREPEESPPLELSANELLRIREEAKKKVDEELAAAHAVERERLMARVFDDEILEQRKAAGLIDYRDDMLDILIDVAPFAADISIDGTVYQHGHWYKVDRRKYDSLREIMARSWDSEDRAGNPNRRFRREVAGTMNPLANEQRLPDGTFTLGPAPTINARTGTVS